jgi:TRAP-type C4-dicarboxylate transport system permease large subunit
LVQTLFFAIGTLVETTPAILILIPVLTPVAVAGGVQFIHFGILVEVNIALGMALPPAGNCLFTVCAITKVRLEECYSTVAAAHRRAEELVPTFRVHSAPPLTWKE